MIESMTEIKGHGTATKDGKGWHVEFSPEFLEEVKGLPLEAQKELDELIKGLEDGSIDPMTMGKRMCGYCGIELPANAPMGINSCEDCLKDMK